MVIVMMGVVKVMIVLTEGLGGLGGNCFCYEETGVGRGRAE